jgi:hypothetical protein
MKVCTQKCYEWNTNPRSQFSIRKRRYVRPRRLAVIDITVVLLVMLTATRDKEEGTKQRSGNIKYEAALCLMCSRVGWGDECVRTSGNSVD